MKKSLKTIGLVSSVIIGIAGIIASGSNNTRTQSEPEPRFTAFSVEPAAVCLNVGVDFVRVSYTVDPDGWSNPSTLCVDVLANGQQIHNTVHHQCLNNGTSGELTFRPTQFFGSNVPSSITVGVRLVPSVAGQEKDSRQTTITTNPACPPPGNIPNP